MLIGLTGSMAAGKSTAADIIRERGVTVIDADAIAHEVLTLPEIKSALCAEFGMEILRGDGEIDRGALASRAFGNGNAERLDAITHPFIRERLLARARDAERERGTAVLDVPLLIESGLNKDCDLVVLITAGIETRYMRIMRRDGLDRQEARARLKCQMPQWRKKRRADVVIRNDGSRAEFEKAIVAFLEDRGL